MWRGDVESASLDHMLDQTGASRRNVVLDDPPDHEVIQRVRSGDTSSYDVIYRRHHDAVHRLARRYAKHASEADDVASEVFAKTLRAIVHGHGPTDDAGPYLLRSVRNTVTSLRIGADARAIPTDDDHLDRPGPQAPLRCDDDDVSLAFLDLPDRYRDVLWATVVEGRGPADIADSSIDAGAVASLTHRARFALRRSYLMSSTRRRCAVDTCREIRRLMPGAVLGQAAATTRGRVDDHARACAECAEVRDDMERLAQQMPARSLVGLLGAWWARLGSSAAQLAGSAGPIVAPAIAATIGVAGVMAAASSDAIDRTAITTRSGVVETEPLEVAAPDIDATTAASESGTAPGTSLVADPTRMPAAVFHLPQSSDGLDPAPPPTGTKSGRRSIAGGATSGVGNLAVTGIAPIGSIDPTIDPADGSPLDELNGTSILDPDGLGAELPGTLTGALGGVVDDLDGVVGEAADGLVVNVVEPVLADAGEIVHATSGALEETIDTTVGGTLDRTVDNWSSTVDHAIETADEVAGAVGSTLGDVTEPLGTTGTRPAPPPTVPVESIVDEVVTATETMTGPTDDTLADAVTDAITGIFGR